MRCSQPGCEVVIGNGQFGATTPRPCNICANAIRAEQMASYRKRYRDKKAGEREPLAVEVPEPRSGLWAK